MEHCMASNASIVYNNAYVLGHEESTQVRSRWADMCVDSSLRYMDGHEESTKNKSTRKNRANQRRRLKSKLREENHHQVSEESTMVESSDEVSYNHSRTTSTSSVCSGTVVFPAQATRALCEPMDAGQPSVLPPPKSQPRDGTGAGSSAESDALSQTSGEVGARVVVKKHDFMGCAVVELQDKSTRDAILITLGDKCKWRGNKVSLKPHVDKTTQEEIPNAIFAAWTRKVDQKTPVPTEVIETFFEAAVKLSTTPQVLAEDFEQNYESSDGTLFVRNSFFDVKEAETLALPKRSSSMPPSFRSRA